MDTQEQERTDTVTRAELEEAIAIMQAKLEYLEAKLGWVASHVPDRRSVPR